jgi:hypothetical protein
MTLKEQFTELTGTKATTKNAQYYLPHLNYRRKDSWIKVNNFIELKQKGIELIKLSEYALLWAYLSKDGSYPYRLQDYVKHLNNGLNPLDEMLKQEIEEGGRNPESYINPKLIHDLSILAPIYRKLQKIYNEYLGFAKFYLSDEVDDYIYLLWEFGLIFIDMELPHATIQDVLDFNFDRDGSSSSTSQMLHRALTKMRFDVIGASYQGNISDLSELPNRLMQRPELKDRLTVPFVASQVSEDYDNLTKVTITPPSQYELNKIDFDNFETKYTKLTEDLGSGQKGWNSFFISLELNRYNELLKWMTAANTVLNDEQLKSIFVNILNLSVVTAEKLMQLDLLFFTAFKLPDNVDKLNIEQLTELKIQLKTAYKKLSKKYHPDLGGSTEKQITINNLYETAMNKLENLKLCTF